MHDTTVDGVVGENGPPLLVISTYFNLICLPFLFLDLSSYEDKSHHWFSVSD